MVKIVLVGEAQGEQEAKLNLSFVGPSGVELIRMLGEAGVIHLSSFDRDYIHRYYTTADPRCIAAIWDLHPEVYRTNVFQLYPPGNDLDHLCGGKGDGIAGYPALAKSKFVRTEFQPELDRLGDEILKFDPNLIVCLGNTPLWALAGKAGITKLRGTTLTSTHTVAGYKLLPTYHPAAILRNWELRPTGIADLMKAQREAQFPEIRRPHREIWIEPQLEDIKTFFKQISPGQLTSVDIETSGNRITCIGFAPSSGLAIVIPFDDERRKNGSYWLDVADETRAWKLIKDFLEDRTIPKLFHNGLYDIGFLWKSMKIKVMGATHDSMLLHHALQPESLKGLGYLGSIYSSEHAWKSMRNKGETTIKRDN